MLPYQREFIQFILDKGALRFGEFKLKSGRLSPYFFNAGMFHDGNAFYKLGNFYADAIQKNFNDKYDVLFGPAYKGISLATAASIGLNIKYNLNVPVSFNRKEAKDHGEGGNIIGASLEGKRVLLIDDVVTAGTTIREAFDIINAAKGRLIGLVIALDRQEKGLTSELSALQELQKTFNIQIASIINLSHISNFLEENNDIQNAQLYLEKIFEYKGSYGTTS